MAEEVDVVRHFASASEATRRAISWMRDLTSRAFVDEERRWEILACAQGWVEMWAFGGREEAIGRDLWLNLLLRKHRDSYVLVLCL